MKRTDPSLKMIDLGPAIAELERIFPMEKRGRPKPKRAQRRPLKPKSR